MLLKNCKINVCSINIITVNIVMLPQYESTPYSIYSNHLFLTVEPLFNSVYSYHMIKTPSTLSM